MVLFSSPILSVMLQPFSIFSLRCSGIRQTVAGETLERVMWVSHD